jgi:hypothetical protein
MTQDQVGGRGRWSYAGRRVGDNPRMQIDHDAIIHDTRRWLEKAVIGLNLCPFAKGVHVKGQIRWRVSDAETPEELARDLADELAFLRDADPDEVDTTLLMHPGVLQDFLDYNDFLDVADAVLAELGLEGELQIASFHPAYQFAGTEPDDLGNLSNRSPYPTLHLIREASLDRAVEAFPQADSIYEENIRTLERLGRAGWQQLWKD